MNENPEARNLMLEHAMRVSNDDLALLPLLDADPGSDQAYATVGAIAQPRLAVGTPLLTWLTGGEVADNWRSYVPATTDSLWSHLLFLRLHLTGATEHDETPLDELLRLRHLADSELLANDF